MGDAEYNAKFENLQRYIPFLDNMIQQLKDPSKKNREAQLSKMESLHAMITDRRRRLKFETLVKCEEVIIKLHQKVVRKNSLRPKAHTQITDIESLFDCAPRKLDDADIVCDFLNDPKQKFDVSRIIAEYKSASDISPKAPYAQRNVDYPINQRYKLFHRKLKTAEIDSDFKKPKHLMGQHKAEAPPPPKINKDLERISTELQPSQNPNQIESLVQTRKCKRDQNGQNKKLIKKRPENLVREISIGIKGERTTVIHRNPNSNVNEFHSYTMVLPRSKKTIIFPKFVTSMTVDVSAIESSSLTYDPAPTRITTAKADEPPSDFQQNSPLTNKQMHTWSFKQHFVRRPEQVSTDIYKVKVAEIYDGTRHYINRVFPALTITGDDMRMFYVPSPYRYILYNFRTDKEVSLLPNRSNTHVSAKFLDVPQVDTSIEGKWRVAKPVCRYWGFRYDFDILLPDGTYESCCIGPRYRYVDIDLATKEMKQGGNPEKISDEELTPEVSRVVPRMIFCARPAGEPISKNYDVVMEFPSGARLSVHVEKKSNVTMVMVPKDENELAEPYVKQIRENYWDDRSLPPLYHHPLVPVRCEMEKISDYMYKVSRTDEVDFNHIFGALVTFPNDEDVIVCIPPFVKYRFVFFKRNSSDAIANNSTTERIKEVDDARKRPRNENLIDLTCDEGFEKINEIVEEVLSRKKMKL